MVSTNLNVFFLKNKTFFKGGADAYSMQICIDKCQFRV